ncbi:archaeal glycosylation protein R [Halolamina pelagica]|uniref:Archaeal glycosylation protein R n=1 Tax=Halolamina pelagica TaxID=699431 RepID=A0A0P7HV50_9EURY|nr:archaeal glycosylation protein R [Halolamina pelagica]
MFTFARYSVPTAVVEDFYKRVDVILIRLFAGESAVGFYETALRIVTPAQQLSGSISNALGVKVSGLTSIGQEIRSDIVNAVIYTGLLAIPMFFGALAMPAALMQTFFGSEFAGGATALIGIALFFVFYIYQDPFATALEGSDRPQIVFRLRLFALVVHLPLALLLGNYWDGLLGVIGATLAVEVVLLAIYQAVSHRELGGIIFPKPVVAQLGSAVVMYGLIMLIKPMVPLVSWVPVIALIVFGAGAYFLSLVVMSSHFRLTLNNVLVPALGRIRTRIR